VATKKGTAKVKKVKVSDLSVRKGSAVKGGRLDKT
jgi:hypothetical protein